jgi:8-oxo-dGTP pyrophosphatase MutT (NUDIX family)
MNISPAAPSDISGRVVVACVLSHRQRFLLLRRSRQVGSDRGLWHCVTGFCETGTEPLDQARQEINEELGVPADRMQLVRQLPPMALRGQDGIWTVHAFHFECASNRVTLNWEHDEAIWLDDYAASGLQTVSWLDAVHDGLTTATRRSAEQSRDDAA